MWGFEQKLQSHKVKAKKRRKKIFPTEKNRDQNAWRNVL